MLKALALILFASVSSACLTGCQSEPSPIQVEGRILNSPGTVGDIPELDAAALQRSVKIIMGSQEIEDRLIRSPEYVSLEQQTNGQFIAIAKDARGLVLSAPGYRLLRKDKEDGNTVRSITFTRPERGVLLEIVPND